MSQNTDPITYRYELDGHEILVTRRHVGEAYARNGNVGNPTQYYVWDSKADGQIATTYEATRAVAYEYARAKALGIPYYCPKDFGRPYPRAVNVRYYRTVQDEMKANYKGKVKV